MWRYLHISFIYLDTSYIKCINVRLLVFVPHRCSVNSVVFLLHSKVAALTWRQWTCDGWACNKGIYRIVIRPSALICCIVCWICRCLIYVYRSYEPVDLRIWLVSSIIRAAKALFILLRYYCTFAKFYVLLLSGYAQTNQRWRQGRPLTVRQTDLRIDRCLQAYEVLDVEVLSLIPIWW